MNSLSNWLAIGFLLILIVIIGFGCKTLFSNQKSVEKVKVSDVKELNSNWLELTPPLPLVATEKHQIIGLKIKNIKSLANPDETKLLLKDGSEVSIEVELIEENGNWTALFPNGFGQYVEFGKRAKNKENIEEANFIIGTKFSKIRLRSDKTIQIEEIIWTEFEF